MRLKRSITLLRSKLRTGAGPKSEYRAKPRRDWYDLGMLIATIVGIAVVAASTGIGFFSSWQQILVARDQLAAMHDQLTDAQLAATKAKTAADLAGARQDKLIGANETLATSTKTLADAAQDQAKSTRIVVSAAQQQVELMQSEQRPWVKVTARADGPLQMMGDLFVLPVAVTVRNEGHSPAFAVNVGSFLTVIPRIAGDEPREVMKRSCDDFRKANWNRHLASITLFPGEEQGWDLGAFGGNNSVIVIGPNEANQATSAAGTNEIGIWFVGCANYRIEGSEKRHQTRFMYRVGVLTRHPDGLVNLTHSIKYGETISADRILLSSAPAPSD